MKRQLTTRIFLVGCSLVLLTLLLRPDRTLIVPGQRVGQYKLHQRWISLRESYAIPATKGLILTFKQEQLDVISVLDERYHTANGLRIGSTTNSVVTAYGQPDRIDGEFWYYDNHGLELMCKTGAVSLINLSIPKNR
jgi:hypothetical protein